MRSLLQVVLVRRIIKKKGGLVCSHFWPPRAVPGLLDDAKQGAVRVALDHLTRLLRASTKKRPLQPPKLTTPPDEKTKLQRMLSELIAKLLVQKGMADMSDYDLKTLVFKAVQDTELEGTVAPPGERPPPSPPRPPPSNPYGHYGSQNEPRQQDGYSSGYPPQHSFSNGKKDNRDGKKKSSYTVVHKLSFLSRFVWLWERVSSWSTQSDSAEAVPRPPRWQGGGNGHISPDASGRRRRRRRRRRRF